MQANAFPLSMHWMHFRGIPKHLIITAQKTTKLLEIDQSGEPFSERLCSLISNLVPVQAELLEVVFLCLFGVGNARAALAQSNT